MIPVVHLHFHRRRTGVTRHVEDVARLLPAEVSGWGLPGGRASAELGRGADASATAMGIINAGTAIGAVCAPPLIAWCLAALNWRWVFFLSGAIGLLWAVWWMRDYHSPQRVVVAEVAIPWLRLLGYVQVWGLVIAKFLSDAAWYFYLFWLPKYLYDARGFDIKAVGATRGFRMRPPASAAWWAAGSPAGCWCETPRWTSPVRSHSA